MMASPEFPRSRSPQGGCFTWPGARAEACVPGHFYSSDEPGRDPAKVLPGIVVFGGSASALHCVSMMREEAGPCLRRELRMFFAGAVE